jgi:hypothetical protein
MGPLADDSKTLTLSSARNQSARPEQEHRSTRFIAAIRLRAQSDHVRARLRFFAGFTPATFGASTVAI